MGICFGIRQLRPPELHVRGMRMKLIAIPAFLAISQTAVAQPITIPLGAPASVEQSAGSLMLRIDGNEAGFDVKVTSKSPVHGCPRNLIHASPHGPDLSEVLPWHVSRQYFPNKRVIPVCSHALTAEVTLVSPELSPDGERFTSGKLVVTLKPSKPVP